MNTKIKGGYLIKPRKIFDSEMLMDAPPLYWKMWDWMVGKANFRESEGVKRGQLFTSVEEMREAMSWKVGFRRERPTPGQIRSAYSAFKAEGMVEIQKTTRGLIITILKYDLYQNFENYEGVGQEPQPGSSLSFILQCGTPYILSAKEVDNLKAEFPRQNVTQVLGQAARWLEGQQDRPNAKDLINWLRRYLGSGTDLFQRLVNLHLTMFEVIQINTGHRTQIKRWIDEGRTFEEIEQVYIKTASTRHAGAAQRWKWVVEEVGKLNGAAPKSMSQTAKGFAVFDEIERRAGDGEVDHQRSYEGFETPLLDAVGQDASSG